VLKYIFEKSFAGFVAGPIKNMLTKPIPPPSIKEFCVLVILREGLIKVMRLFRWSLGWSLRRRGSCSGEYFA
jgi:hypothetical protein